MERRSKPLQDRSKKYVEKSMELTSVKRCLEDQLKALSEENKKLVLLAFMFFIDYSVSTTENINWNKIISYFR